MTCCQAAMDRVAALLREAHAFGGAKEPPPTILRAIVEAAQPQSGDERGRLKPEPWMAKSTREDYRP